MPIEIQLELKKFLESRFLVFIFVLISCWGFWQAVSKITIKRWFKLFGKHSWFSLREYSIADIIFSILTFISAVLLSLRLR